MEPDLREYIRDVYRSLTDIGTEADQTVDSRFAAAAKPSQNGAAAVKVTQPETSTQPGTSTRPSEPRAQPVLATAAGLSVANPFGVVAAAVRTIAQNRVQAFWLGLLVVGASTIASYFLILENIRLGRLQLELRWLQLCVLAVVTYLLCWWMRVGRTGAVKSSAGINFADGLVFAAIAAIASLVWPIVLENVDIPYIIENAAYLTRDWPLSGAFASMTYGAVPPAMPFVETFMHAVAVLPAIPFVPFIVGRKSGRQQSWFICFCGSRFCSSRSPFARSRSQS